jgi:hypothetical protein
MSTGEQLRNNAKNCAVLADEAKNEADRKRYQRIEQAWLTLAETQDWLDGKTPHSVAKVTSN